MSDKKEVWAILELMGHVRLAGRVTEEEQFGSKLGRIDIPGKDGTFTTQFFGGGSIYRMTVVTEAVARGIAETCNPAPIQPWEYPKPALTHQPVIPDYDPDERLEPDEDDEPDDEGEWHR